MKKTCLFFLFFILLLALVLRFYHLSTVPNGFYSDEAAYGYNALSLLKTGKDEYGEFLPAVFKSFGDYKAPLYIYMIAPLVSLFGLSEITIRSTSALLGVLSIILIFYLTKKIFASPKLALVSSLFITISPLSLQFSRMAHENNLTVTLILVSLIFFLKSLKNPRFYIPTAISFALSIYTYHDARVLTPLLVIFLLFNFRKYIAWSDKYFIAAFISFLLLLIPFLKILTTSNALSRPKNTIFLADLGTLNVINQERGEDQNSHYISPYIYHNKVLEYSKKFISNYLSHFSPDFMFITGDNVKIYSTPGHGIEFISILPLLVLGFIYLSRKINKLTLIILILLIIVPIPSALTKFVPSASRTLSLVIPLSILSALGVKYLLSYRSHFYKIALITTLILIFNVGNYLHYYYINTPIRYAREWHYGAKEMLSEVKKLENNYDSVWFSKNTWGYIYPLFYYQYPPEKYQKQANLSPPNEYGFGWVYGFDKYIFKDFPRNMGDLPNILYVGVPDDFWVIKSPLEIIYYPSGAPAFYIADNKSL